MNIKTYESKVLGCWYGKNIGGSLGAPFECFRGVWDLEFYTADLSKGALPNDDLDLQLVWLNAVEQYGRGINPEILGEYWLSYIVGNWSEYGAGKNNMSVGLLPPISGWYNNHNKDSCGSFIRSEIWACLMPGHPELAVKYAYMDAICDHADEGVYAEVFCTAIESAAFFESDKFKLIDIGLSYIPKDCGIALAVKTALKCYNEGFDWKEARKKILNIVPCSFGMYNGYPEGQILEEDVPVGKLGYDAPANIGIIIIAWLYGENDFGKSLCIAAGCGEDGDCTAATLGSILGIIDGIDGIPTKWIEPIGEEIKTISVDLTSSVIDIPKTIPELTKRVCRQMPVFMGDFCDVLVEGVEIKSSKNFYDDKQKFGIFEKKDFKDMLGMQPFCIKKESVLFDIYFDYVDGIKIEEGCEKKVKLHIRNKLSNQQWIVAKWSMPEEWGISPSKEQHICLDQYHGGRAFHTYEFSIMANNLNKGRYDLLLEILSNGRLSKIFIPVILLV